MSWPRPRRPGIRSPGKLWRDRRGRIRSGWRVGLWALAVVAALSVAAVAGVDRLPRTAAALVNLVLVGGVSLAAWRVLEGRSPRSTWLAVDGAMAMRLARGLLAGALLVALALVPLAVSGSLKVFLFECRVVHQGGFLLATGAFFLVAGALEEVLFRGYPLFALRTGPGRAAAVAVTAVVFSALHAANPHFDLVAAVVLTWIGIVLAVSVLQTGSVWEAVGIHAGWNWALGSGVALPVSGVAQPSPCYAGVLSGPEWLTGGGFGLESGVAGAGAWALAGVGLWWRARRERSRE